MPRVPIIGACAPFCASTSAPSFRFRWTGGVLSAFVHSAVRLGVIGKERFQYWRLLAWTFFHRPRHLPLGDHARDLRPSLPQVLCGDGRVGARGLS